MENIIVCPNCDFPIDYSINDECPNCGHSILLDETDEEINWELIIDDDKEICM
ncbi:hypothetical protein KNV65_gp106 [Enterococcus phage 9183]|jgi:DNA-directed RNA polymerase subunit RPC12/RpoP|uniref:Uncharacterized protein n=1 Tax=Enterococcus phage 9183 TaxID=2763102 RepID=A0A7L7SMM7_9CAUD|nr:hypothetical protein KNV65_gp106 [Enterococcus phage 9183]QOC57596.1 hypothetical protein phi9183_ORF103 [Enterococcus phage 9183]DAM31083.1 MAG TPA: TFIIB-TERMINAL DOMAIN, TFIIB, TRANSCRIPTION INITIATION [Caudoviricetes sp.]